MVQVAPLLSSVSFPQIGKIGLSIFITILLVPAVIGRGYFLPSSALEYGLLLIGEALLGILIGFLVLMVFSIFQIAGKFFSLQMGFGAAEVFDPVAQIQIPLLGQFFNLLAYAEDIIGPLIISRILLRSIFVSNLNTFDRPIIISLLL